MTDFSTESYFCLQQVQLENVPQATNVPQRTVPQEMQKQERTETTQDS